MKNIFQTQKKVIYVFSGILFILVGIFGYSVLKNNKEIIDYSIVSLSLSPGADETQYNISWISIDSYSSGAIEVTEENDQSLNINSNMKTQKVKAEVKKAYRGFVKNEVTIRSLKPSTVYSYRLGDGKGNWTESKYFETKDPNKFSFLFMGDPQIGSSGDTEADEERWIDTLDKATSMYPESSFIQSAGDQVENANSKEQYSSFFAPEILEKLPLAATVGNHDDGVLYKDYFNMPNQSMEIGDTEDSPGNYYYTYGNTLIMNLNSNSNDVGEHIRFLKDTVATTKSLDIKWKILVFHHSIYSVGEHASSPDITALRAGLVPVIDEMGIDAVLMGHDHTYARSYQMKSLLPLKNQEIQGNAVINPKGTLYITANSSSGSKYYALSQEEQPYAVVKEQLWVPTFTNVNVTEESLEFLTYRTDTMEMTDSYKIIKDESRIVELPGFKSAEMNATGFMLPIEPSTFYPEVSLFVTGTNVEGGPYDIAYENIVYKTDSENQIWIGQQGEIKVLEGARTGKVEIWAEIDVDGKIIVTDKVSIDLIEHNEKELVSPKSTWSYLDNGSNQEYEWQKNEFDDSGWETGEAPLGYPEDESRPTFEKIETIVDYGEDEEDKYATTYFRTEFEVEDISSIGNLGYIEFEVDDGLLLYLNGNEIVRFNLPNGEILYDNYLKDIIDEDLGNESQTERIYLNENQLKFLKQGKNVLAAEVHQSRPDSSDLYWAMKLITN